MAKNNDIKKKRYVAFIDILGFKNKVDNELHELVYGELKFIKDTVRTMRDEELMNNYKDVFKLEDSPDQTDSFMFSDSLFIYSKGDTTEDLIKITLDLALILSRVTERGIPIKGAVSFGEVSIDKQENIFFGKPIINAALLHDQLHQIGIVCDHTFEKKLMEVNNKIKKPKPKVFYAFYDSDKLFFKTGRINHLHLTPGVKSKINPFLENLRAMYLKVSGNHRRYIDNSLQFYQEWEKGK